MIIDRQLSISSSPQQVTAALSQSPIWPAIVVLPQGAGSKVTLNADISPDSLAVSYEAAAMAWLCEVKRVLERGYHGAMGRSFDTITKQMKSFVADQHMFFVATAPGDGGNINLSPKGYDSFRIIDDHTVCYLDLTGSGAETIAHLLDNGRITFMFCAFEGKPDIVRFYGNGRVVQTNDAEWERLYELFPDMAGARAIIVADIHRTSNACGMAVPFMDYSGEREQLTEYWEARSSDELSTYWTSRNAESIDGLHAMRP